MAGIKIQKISVADAANPEKIPYADALSAKMFNVAGGLAAKEYDFTDGVSYSMEERSIQGTMREIWYVHDKNQNKISAASFFKHDEEGKTFSGFEGGNNMLALVAWLAGKKLVRTDRKAVEWGAKFDNGQLVGQNVNLGDERFYYNVA